MYADIFYTKKAIAIESYNRAQELTVQASDRGNGQPGINGCERERPRSWYRQYNLDLARKSDR
jgi:hypothetical protein